MQITVTRPGGTMLATPVSQQVRVSGMDEIEPSIPLNNMTLDALAAGADRVEIIGQTLTGALTRIDDFIRLEVARGRPFSTRYIIYEFSGWQEK